MISQFDLTLCYLLSVSLSGGLCICHPYHFSVMEYVVAMGDDHELIRL